MSSASTGNTEGSTTSSSPASSVNLITTNTHISQPQHNTISNNNNNAPKYGTRVPNRIFVGGISGSTTETELAQLFSAYGSVKATKVISDRAGVSKGYGFVTFETEEEAKRLVEISESIILKERKLNIAPAIKKQPFNRTYEAASPPAVHSSTIFYQNGVPYTFHNGVAYFPATPPQHTTGNTVTTAGDSSGMYQATFGPPPAASAHSPAAAAAAYPVIYPCSAPPAMYMSPQQFQYQPMPPPAPTSQYVYTASTSSTSAAAPGTGPPVSQGSPMLGAPAPMPPTQHYFAPAPLNPTDIYYSMPQPYNAMMNEGIVYEATPPAEASSNQSAEDSCSNSSNSDTVRSGGGGSYKPPPNQEKTVAKHDSKPSGNGGWVAPTTTANNQSVMQRQNASTPVVSLLKLQQMGEELDICPTKKCSSPTIQDYMTTPPPQQMYYQQVPPPLLNPNKSQTPLVPVLYQSVPPMFVAPTGQPSGTSPYMSQFPTPGMANGHSDQSGSNYPAQFQNHRAPYATKPYTHRRGGASSGNQASPMTVHIPPFPPKFHFMNNNQMPVPGVNNPHTQGSNQKRHYNNRNLNQQLRGRDSGRYMGASPGRLQRRFYSTTTVGIVNKNSACAISTSNASATADSSIPHAATSDIMTTPITTITTTTSTTTTTTNTNTTTTSTSITTTMSATTTTAAITTSAATITTDASSPPPAPYSPMTHPVIDSASPQQVQLFSGTGSSASHQTYYPPSNGMQQQFVPPRRFFSNSRKSGGSTLNGGNTSVSGGARNSGGGNGKYSKSVVNSVQVMSGISSLMGGVDEGSLGSVGDAPPTSCAVMQEACHQMQALSL